MRIGIVTFYRGNHNYGGILQAFALQKYLEQSGYEALQIGLDYTDSNSLSKIQKLFKLLKMGDKAIPVLQEKIKNRRIQKATCEIRRSIATGFEQFENVIPHTLKSYHAEEMKLLNDEFDAFICGSDQVWAPLSNEWYTFPHTGSYFLGFTNKKKISYAASFGISNIPDDYLKAVAPYLEKFDSISVREASVVPILKDRLHRDIDVVVDPTLLYTGAEWVEMFQIEQSPKNVIFSYILGNSSENRDIVKSCARDMSLKLDTVPFIGDFTPEDFSFGDEQLIGITPEAFLSNIYNAAYIVTDSFHCAVFAILFKKQFAVLKRSNDNTKGEMNGRLYDLLRSIGLENRVCNEKKSLFAILKTEISYKNIDSKLNCDRVRSQNWLKQQLDK